jgi:non-canonical (house-cleaning) NTP pyrophosphatase
VVYSNDKPALAFATERGKQAAQNGHVADYCVVEGGIYGGEFTHYQFMHIFSHRNQHEQSPSRVSIPIIMHNIPFSISHANYRSVVWQRHEIMHNVCLLFLQSGT